MTADAPGSDGGARYVSDVLDALAPMGGYTFDSPDGGEPSVARIPVALRAAAAAGFDPEAIYQRAVAMYRTLNERRRRNRPRWNWPAPSYRDVRPDGGPARTGARRLR